MLTLSGRTVLGCAALVVASSVAAAQSQQDYSIQASGLLGAMSYNGTQQPGYGAEGQFRFNHVMSSANGVLSVGVGGQFTQHSFSDGNINITGGFIEPRYAFSVSSTRVFPYIAGRLAVLQQSGDKLDSSIGYAVGGGGGFAIALSSRHNLDIGAAALYQSFGNTTITGSKTKVEFTPFLGYAVKVGLSLGL